MAQEKRYWDHEEIGREAGGLIQAEDALEKAVAEIEVLPSRSGELVGDGSVADADLTALRGILERVASEGDRAAESAADSYADHCEEQASAVAAEREESRA